MGRMKDLTIPPYDVPTGENNWPRLLNIGPRTYDADGRVCRASDSYNELRAIFVLLTYIQRLHDTTLYYCPTSDPFGPIDGTLMSGDLEYFHLEIKSHAGRLMGKETILNLRKWSALVEKNAETDVPVLFIAQYENAVLFQEIDQLLKVVEELTPVQITDSTSVSRSTSTEDVWMIPTSAFTIVKPIPNPLPDFQLDALNIISEKIMETSQ